MTNEEAIEQLKKHTLSDNTGFTDENDLEATEMAIEALEKQIPQKPIFGPYKHRKGYGRMCPACGYNITNCKHCRMCGQMLDLSDYKEE